MSLIAPRRLAAVALTLALGGFTAPATMAAPARAASPHAAAQTDRQPVITAPPMGWNDWNTFGCDISAQLVEQTADAIVDKGLQAAGYDYVNIDDCWATKDRDADGHLVPDPTKFPDGISAVADYVHAKGLKLGIYADAGSKTCAGYPGSLGHETVDAQTFADWGVDLLKYDNCNSGTTPAADRYQAMSDALAATGRKIVFSICEWGSNAPWDWAPALGDYWRIDGDITPAWTSVRSIARQLMRVGNGWSGPGFPDPDMLEVGNGALTPTEERTHFGLWALYGAPLILGNDLRDIDADSQAVITDRDVIAVDQQAAGHAVREVASGHGTYVLTRGMADGSTIVALYNETGNPAPISTTAAAAGIGKAAAYSVKDLWQGTTTATTGDLTAQVLSHGLTLLQVTPAKSTKGAAPVVTLDAPQGAGTQEFLSGPDGTDTTLTVSAPKGGGTLRNVEATLDLPGGWTTATSKTVDFGTVKDGASVTRTWRIKPTGTAAGNVLATVTWGSGSSRDVRLRLTPTPAAPDGKTSVAALPWLHSWAGYASPERNTGIEGQALAVNGKTYATGIGTHAESEVAVWLGGRCTKLTTSFGMQDGGGGSVKGIVLGDGRSLAATGVKRAGEDADDLTVDVTGVDYLELHGDVGDGSSWSSRMVWGGTDLTCAGFSASGPKVFVTGQSGEVTTSLTAGPDGASDITASLDVPDGWTAEATTPATDATLAPNQTFNTTWSVTPASGATGSNQITASATYTVDGKTTTESRTVSATVARSPHYVYSQSYDGPSYKRLTKEVAVPAGGGSLTFWTNYDAEQSWDYLFVEAHTPGQDDWTTLPDANGHTATTPGDSCTNGWNTLHPWLAHYQTQSGSTCTSTGTTGTWNAVTGKSNGWQQWSIDLSHWAGGTVEVSVAYASDWGGQGNGVFIDDAVEPDGTTDDFEDGLDGWSVPGAPAGDPANPNDFAVVDASKYPVS